MGAVHIYGRFGDNYSELIKTIENGKFKVEYKAMSYKDFDRKAKIYNQEKAPLILRNGRAYLSGITTIVKELKEV